MSSEEKFNRYRPHPWHGLSVGKNAPEVVTAYIEITPTDTVKYEICKETGYLMIDRPQRTSAQQPTLYGFIPRTYCGDRVHKLHPNADKSDHDPLDICVISDRPVSHNEILCEARVIGGLPMIDGGEADDKIIAVLKKDWVWDDVKDIDDLPPIFIERLTHYFMTYKQVPGKELDVSIDGFYGRERAYEVIKASMDDYDEKFGHLNED